MHYKVVYLVAQTMSGKQQAQAMRVEALKNYDCHRLTKGERKGECPIIIASIREGLGATDEVVSIMITEEEQGLEDGGQGGGGEIIEETWRP